MHSCTNEFRSFKCTIDNTEEKHKSICKKDTSMSPVNLHFSNTTCVTDMLNTYSSAIEEH